MSINTWNCDKYFPRNTSYFNSRFYYRRQYFLLNKSGIFYEKAFLIALNIWALNTWPIIKPRIKTSCFEAQFCALFNDKEY